MIGRVLSWTGWVTVIATAGWAQRTPAPQPTQPSRQAMLVAEDGRGTTEVELAPLFQGLASRDPVTASIAIRAIGRFERPGLMGRLLPFLADSRVAVRVATAHALGQIGQDTAAVPGIAPLLIERVGEEQDPTVLAALARSVGRLAYRSAERATAAQTALVALAGRPLPLEQRVEVTRALEALVRTSRPLLERHPDLLPRLGALAVLTDRDTASAVRIRRAAVAALSRAARPVDSLLVQLGSDPDVEVRRLAIAWAATDSLGLDARRNYVTAALGDRNPMVRVEALRVWGRHFQSRDCGPLVRAVRDKDWHVALQAIELLGNPCPETVDASELLWPMVDSLAGSQRGDFTTIANWHRGAYALLALARIDPNRAKAVLSRAGAARAWQIRMYAARAAAIVGDGDRLVTFADDPNDNVREAAIAGLLRVRGHGIDSVYRIQLARSDYQLVMAAAAALEGSPDRPRGVAALRAALARITAERKETSRDVRLAILERLAELGQADDAPTLEPYLVDFDPVIAGRAAALIRSWTGQQREITPTAMPRRPLDASLIDRFRGARLRVAMAPSSGGGAFEIALYPDLAPATVARVAALAERGYYDGLTFHRVVANFVIQGGSPRANEYAGDALYLRDEVGPLTHERGTLGISTRGRDTGDAQIFVNLVDNLRLDFNYTVWGRVTSGMDVVDSILEGDVIDRIDVID
jgi:cyclophilin family peptidyl-prolyl cis-trans isomerase/HEAT repeat protein